MDDVAGNMSLSVERGSPGPRTTRAVHIAVDTSEGGHGVGSDGSTVTLAGWLDVSTDVVLILPPVVAAGAGLGAGWRRNMLRNA